MPLVLRSGPDIEPVTLVEAKAFCRIDDDAGDALFSSLIVTSRLHIEAALGLALIAQSWTLKLDAWPRGAHLELPIRPLLSVDEVRIRAKGAAAVVVPSSDYSVAADWVPPRLSADADRWPDVAPVPGGVEIDITAGFGLNAEDVPAPIRHALLVLVAHWHEHRDSVAVGAEATRIPAMVHQLLEPYRIKRL